ncbi:MAG: GFA family protein [Alphaproteobacteria bacterium]
MSDTHTGGCLCGGVRYTVTGQMSDVVSCHCTQCRKTSGHYVSAARVDVPNLVIDTDETLTWFRASDTARRGFCSRCGGNLFWWPDSDTHVSVMAGTIDGATGLKTEKHIFTDTKGDYYEL